MPEECRSRMMFSTSVKFSLPSLTPIAQCATKIESSHPPLHVRVVLGEAHEEVDVLDNGVGPALRHQPHRVGDVVDQFQLTFGMFW